MSAKYQGYSLTFWPKIADLDHLSICNQNKPTSMLVIFRQNTKVIALLFGQTSLIFITFQSGIKINQFQFWSFLGKIPRLQHFFLANIPQFHYLSIFNHNQSMSMLVIFRQTTKAIALLFGQTSLIWITFQSAIKISQLQFWSFMGKYQGYSLTFWPKIADLDHFSICNQNKPTSILVIYGQNTKAIALLFGQKSLTWITFQSAIKISQLQFWSFMGKIPRLQPYFLAKNR